MSRKGTYLLVGISLSSVLGAALAAWGGLDFAQREFPDVAILKRSYPVVHVQREEGLLASEPTVTISFSSTRPSGWTNLGEVSKVAVGAIIVSEDWAFYQHKGYDPTQIRAAFEEDVEEGHYARGASTITQQVVRNAFLDKDKNLWRKFKELYLAMKIEESVSKRRILETYLNIAEWGDGIYGIRAAANLYFGKSPDQLTAREGAFLAMLLPSPKRYSQSFRARKLTPYAQETMDSILSKMVRARYISPEQRDDSLEAHSVGGFFR